MADVTVKLTIGSLSAEVSGPSDYVDKKIEELVSRFLGPWKSSAAGEVRAHAAAGGGAAKKTSPAEFLKIGGPKNQPDRALMLAYYLEKVEGVSPFNSSQLSELGRTVREPFTNVSDTVAKLTGRGLMMSAGDKDGQRAYALTASGETYVEAMLEEK